MAVSRGQRKAGQARDHENAEKDDFTPTPWDALWPLLEHEEFEGKVWEPACGEGHISRFLKGIGYDVISSDLIDRGYGEPRVDFLMEWTPRAENVITNPPFKLAREFILKALALTTGKVVMFLPLSYLAGLRRWQEIYNVTPPARVYVFISRVQMKRGGTDGGEGGGGMINFMWAVWDRSHKGRTEVYWI